jgi:hypothetical protein
VAGSYGSAALAVSRHQRLLPNLDILPVLRIEALGRIGAIFAIRNE